ncbi:sugar kinase [Sphaerisporangium rufum]|uniref:Sugar kinase n=1 Tax=Sphaerisporangium rufum TaxID=1381558 RepID=A0A919R8I5_9ACTN|nr:ROK family transcriptional regulator [Sphaerisporangium rufum]GII79265.1 sugar kinase [Sphaerisporangium rufum]
MTLTAGQALQLVRQGTCRTRKELIEHTGLSRSTVTDRVDRLIAAGYLREAGVGRSGGGRPPAMLTVGSPGQLVLAADLGATHATVAVTDLAGEPLAVERLALRIALGPGPVLARVQEAFGRLLEAAGREDARVVGVGVDLPGSIDPATGQVIKSFAMPGWDDHPIREDLAAGREVPVVVENDAKAMALGEWRASWRDCPSLLLVKVSTGIGAGIVLAGDIYHGTDQAAGNIGHVRSGDSGDRVCTCGSRGCVASVASGQAIADDLGVAGSREVVELVQAADPAAIARVGEAGRTLGVVLATAVNLLNPGVLVLAGDMAETGEHYLTGIREAVYRHSLPYVTRNLQIVTGRLGDLAGVVGTASLVADQVLSAGAVDAALR